MLIHQYDRSKARRVAAVEASEALSHTAAFSVSTARDHAQKGAVTGSDSSQVQRVL
jgi:hypothetical protein